MRFPGDLNEALRSARDGLHEILLELDHRSLSAEGLADAAQVSADHDRHAAVAHAYAEAAHLIDERLRWLVGRREARPAPRVGVLSDPDLRPSTDPYLPQARTTYSE